MIVIKFKKKFKKKNKSAVKKNFLGLCQLGFFGIKALNSGVITPKQLETARRIIVRFTKRTGKLFVRLFFEQPLTAKAKGSRMGKGVGVIKSWVSVVRRGLILIELLGVPKKQVVEAFQSIQKRLFIKIGLIER
jgi:large subunit ribosomal protein L16